MTNLIILAFAVISFVFGVVTSSGASVSERVIGYAIAILAFFNLILLSLLY